MGVENQLLRGSITGLAAVCTFAVSDVAQAVKFDFHGDLDHRFELYSNQRDWFTAGGSGAVGLLREDGEDENFGEFKYRFWTEVATDDDAVKGVIAFEIGGVRFGEGTGGDFSGDGTNVETRWAYVDFGLPAATEQRLTIGLQPHSVNEHIWQETATGVALTGPLALAFPEATYNFAWMRGDEAEAGLDDDGFSGADNLSVELNVQPMVGLDTGVFVLYQRNDQTSEGLGTVDATTYEIKSIADNSRYDVWSFGTDGGYSLPTGFGDAFFNWNLIYQTGDIEDVEFSPAGTDATTASGDFDLSAFFGRADLGVNVGPTKLTYTFWYASGDDDASDNDFDAFMATDVDNSESMIFFENMTSDDFFAETYYLLDKGFLLNKLQVDHKLTSQVTVSGQVAYHLLAEDVNLANGSSEDTLGWELGGGVSYMPYPNLDIAAEIAYLLADDGMDFFEEESIQDGESDEDIFHSAMRVRYKF